MNIKQKKFLEDTIYNRINALFLMDNIPSVQFITQIEFAAKNDLFFPAYYELVYSSMISYYVFSKELSHVVQAKSFFGISVEDNNCLLYRAILHSMSELENIFHSGVSSASDYLLTLHNLFDLGVFFEHSFFEDPLFIAYYNESLLKDLVKLNQESKIRYSHKLLNDVIEVKEEDNKKIVKI